jgi:hypothetical protein
MLISLIVIALSMPMFVFFAVQVCLLFRATKPDSDGSSSPMRATQRRGGLRRRRSGLEFAGGFEIV